MPRKELQKQQKRQRVKLQPATHNDKLLASEKQLAAMQSLGRALSSTLDREKLLHTIMQEVTDLMSAQRSTLFIYDAMKNQLWSMIAQGADKHVITVSVGKGVAGWVAKYKKVVNIKDAYADKRFNTDVDKKTGFTTKAILCMPLSDSHGALLGVLQVLNKKDNSYFNRQDQELLSVLGTQVAFALENSHMYHELLEQNRALDMAKASAERRGEELDILYRIEQEVSKHNNLEKLLDSIIETVVKHLKAEAGSILLIEKNSNYLYFKAAVGSKKDEVKKLQLKTGQGIVGWVAQHGEPLIVTNAPSDPRHYNEIAKKLKFPAQEIICVPLKWKGTVLGAVEVIHKSQKGKKSNKTFGPEDLRWLSLLSNQIAQALAIQLQRQQERNDERLIAMGSMLANVTHDLKNPMAVISGYAEILENEDDTKLRKIFSKNIVDQVDEMATMVNDLLAYACDETHLVVQKEDWPTLWNKIIEEIKAQNIRYEVKLKISKACVCAVNVDSSKIKRIILNLVKNAFEVLSADHTLTITCKKLKNNLQVIVQDDGPGIPESIQNNLFDAFVTHGKKNGTGLGLNIVKQFVEEHQGRIELNATVKKGASFRINLPVIVT